MYTFQKQFFPELLASNLSGEQASDPCEPCCCACSTEQFAQTILFSRRQAAVSEPLPLLLRLLCLLCSRRAWPPCSRDGTSSEAREGGPRPQPLRASQAVATS